MFGTRKPRGKTDKNHELKPRKNRGEMVKERPVVFCSVTFGFNALCLCGFTSRYLRLYLTVFAVQRLWRSFSTFFRRISTLEHKTYLLAELPFFYLNHSEIINRVIACLSKGGPVSRVGGPGFPKGGQLFYLVR